MSANKKNRTAKLFRPQANPEIGEEMAAEIVPSDTELKFRHMLGEIASTKSMLVEFLYQSNEQTAPENNENAKREEADMLQIITEPGLRYINHPKLASRSDRVGIAVTSLRVTNYGMLRESPRDPEPVPFLIVKKKVELTEHGMIDDHDEQRYPYELQWLGVNGTIRNFNDMAEEVKLYEIPLHSQGRLVAFAKESRLMGLFSEDDRH